MQAFTLTTELVSQLSIALLASAFMKQQATRSVDQTDSCIVQSCRANAKLLQRTTQACTTVYMLLLADDCSTDPLYH